MDHSIAGFHVGSDLNKGLKWRNVLAVGKWYQQNSDDVLEIEFAVQLVHKLLSVDQLAVGEARIVKRLAAEWQALMVLSGALTKAEYKDKCTTFTADLTEMTAFPADYTRKGFKPEWNGVVITWSVYDHPLEGVDMNLVYASLPLYKGLLSGMLRGFCEHQNLKYPLDCPSKLLNIMECTKHTVENRMFSGCTFLLLDPSSALTFVILAFGGKISRDAGEGDAVTYYVVPDSVAAS